MPEEMYFGPVDDEEMESMDHGDYASDGHHEDDGDDIMYMEYDSELEDDEFADDDDDDMYEDEEDDDLYVDEEVEVELDDDDDEHTEARKDMWSNIDWDKD